MAYNPFLSMTEPAAPVAAEVLNPFMMSDADSTVFSGDNPFTASNPFSDFGGGYEPPVGDTVPVDIFGGVEPTSIGAKQFDGFMSENTSEMDMFGRTPIENERLVKPTELDLISTLSDNTNENDDFDMQPPVRPLPPETQNLILSVTGQMEYTSSHLLDRIPLTRTPSPVSVRDIHSPSPTPEAEPELIEEPAPAQCIDLNRPKPTRPPPARPPPVARPPPPRPVPPPKTQPVKPPPLTDDINLFDAPAPAIIKPTKEAILSLYSAPKKEEKQIDFLSDDILDEGTGELSLDTQAEASDNAAKPIDSLDLVMKESDPTCEPTSMALSSGAASDSEAPMDCSEPSSNIFAAPSNTSPFADTVYDDQQLFSNTNEAEKNPFGANETRDVTFCEPATDFFGTKASDPVLASSSEGFDIIQSETLASTEAGRLSALGENIFGTTPTDSCFEDKEADMFNVEEEDAFNMGQGNAFDVQALPATEPTWGASVEAMAQEPFPESQDAFDAFSAKFDSTSANHVNTAAWGDDGTGAIDTAGFEAEAFDPFLSMGAPPPPAATPRQDRPPSTDSPDDTFSLFIRPKEVGAATGANQAAVPVLAPPPRAPEPESPRANPFDQPAPELQLRLEPTPLHDLGRDQSDGGETPPTPLFDDDVSMPLEVFPRTQYSGPGWEMHLRQPNKKKITGQRFWKKIFVKLTYQGDSPVVQLYNSAADREPFQELPLQACYSVSEVGAQQFDQFGKIFTVKLQYVFYKERPGVRPGQVTKAERITNKLSQFAAYAIQGDYQGVKEFGSDLRKLGLPVEHAPQVSQLFKLGSLSYEDVKQFSCTVEEALFRLPAHRDRALTYKMEEVQVTAVDELYVEQDAEGAVLKQIARVRLFFLGFLSGMPDVELGVNDLRRQGREVVGRHDIIPVVTEEWIRVEDVSFHACVQPHEFDETQIIKFKPPDACYIELMRFRVRPPKNRELPLQLKAVWCVTGNKVRHRYIKTVNNPTMIGLADLESILGVELKFKPRNSRRGMSLIMLGNIVRKLVKKLNDVELRADVLVPGFASRKLGQVPCEDVAIRFPIPECWIYLFRVEKHFRYGSVKSAHRRTGKIKGIERFLGAVDTLQESLIEVTSGQAKYEHQHRAIVWRMPRLPKEGQGAYTTHNLVCRMALTSYDQVPERLAPHAHVEFTMPAAQVSHTTVRSISLQNHDNDPPEKCVRYLARHEYLVGIERTSGQSAPAYSIAASAPAEPRPEPIAESPALPQPPSSDSDSD